MRGGECEGVSEVRGGGGGGGGRNEKDGEVGLKSIL